MFDSRLRSSTNMMDNFLCKSLIFEIKPPDANKLSHYPCYLMAIYLFLCFSYLHSWLSKKDKQMIRDLERKEWRPSLKAEMITLVVKLWPLRVAAFLFAL
ncbi:hypothetical protein DXN04_29275 [Chitinophaga silvisoli]|uniref:Uncharacterized protein n=1 Tax=Chitinophaga silvisoli TaxID=2291814 RepID=A0A3E1NUN7_9BACT|nr:hypothetical protein DXN04_29275 [Chitinophaga silvisoli]